MKFLFDQNISHKILKHYPTPHFTSVKKEKLLNATDIEIWEFAKCNDYNIITQDSDFNDLNLLYGFPPKIIWIRAGNLKTQELAFLLSEYWEEILRFISDKEYGCFEIFKLYNQ